MPKAAKQKSKDDKIPTRLIVLEALYTSPGRKPLTSARCVEHGIQQGYWKEETGSVKGQVTRALNNLLDNKKIIHATKQSFSLTDSGVEEMAEFDVSSGEESVDEVPVKKTPSKKAPSSTSSNKTSSAPKKKKKSSK